MRSSQSRAIRGSPRVEMRNSMCPTAIQSTNTGSPFHPSPRPSPLPLPFRSRSLSLLLFPIATASTPTKNPFPPSYHSLCFFQPDTLCSLLHKFPSGAAPSVLTSASPTFVSTFDSRLATLAKPSDAVGRIYTHLPSIHHIYFINHAYGCPCFSSCRPRRSGSRTGARRYRHLYERQVRTPPSPCFDLESLAQQTTPVILMYATSLYTKSFAAVSRTRRASISMVTQEVREYSLECCHNMGLFALRSRCWYARVVPLEKEQKSRR